MNARLLTKLRKVFAEHGLYRSMYGKLFIDPPHHIIHIWSPQNWGKRWPKKMKLLQLGIKEGLVRRERIPRETFGWSKNERRYILIPAETAYRLGVQSAKEEK